MAERGPVRAGHRVSAHWPAGPLRLGVLLALSGSVHTAAAVAPALPEAQVSDPPAFGHQIGDVVWRRIELRLPAGARFDPASLPPPSRQGAAIELGWVSHAGPPVAAVQRVDMRYQIFRSPTQPQVLELPALSLRFTVPAATGNRRREMALRIDAHPLVVSPLAPDPAPQRAGLGPLQPDLPTPSVPVDAAQARQGAFAALLALGLAWLAARHVLRPWWQRRQRPFGLAWRQVRQALPSGQPADAARLQAAYRHVHAALQADAGRVLLAADLPGWLAQRPRYAGLAAALGQFHAQSALSFFAPPADQPDADQRQAQAQALCALAQALARAEAAP